MGEEKENSGKKRRSGGGGGEVKNYLFLSPSSLLYMPPSQAICYDNSCYRLISFKYQLSRLFISRCDLVSFGFAISSVTTYCELDLRT